MNVQLLKNIIEAALLTASGPLPIVKLQTLFAELDVDEQPDKDKIQACLDELIHDYTGRGIELRQVSSGYRIQARQDMGLWLNRLNEERPSRYSRALLETLALVAYRQPITRAGVEDIRGVSVSTSIMKTLIEREWIRIVGHRDVPGRPALYGTTKIFLDYFNLQNLGELPPLAEMRSIDEIQREFELNFDAKGTTEPLLDKVEDGSKSEMNHSAEDVPSENENDSDKGQYKPAPAVENSDELKLEVACVKKTASNEPIDGEVESVHSHEREPEPAANENRTDQVDCEQDKELLTENA